MNNDITCNANINKMHKLESCIISSKEQMQSEVAMQDETLMRNSLDALKSIGQSQILMTNPIAAQVRASLDAYTKNPELIEAQMEFCDSLIEKGYKSETAMLITEEVFKILEQEAKETL